jgi:HAE1 family hydrophobic/amphiphilic exporter-1
MGNRSIGTAAAGGMLMGTLFGVVLVPGLYVIFAGLAEFKRKKGKVQLSEEQKHEPEAVLT